MQYYYDTNIKGFITDITHEITESSFPISDEKYNELLTGVNSGYTIEVVNGEVLLGDIPLELLKFNKKQVLDSFISSSIEQGITELGIKTSLNQTTIGYLAAIAYLNNATNVIHDSGDIYHTGLTNADVAQVLELALQAYHDLIAYKKAKELEIESALDQTELDAIVIGTDF